MKIEIIPATDIIGGACVRLTQGDYGRRTTYYRDPLEAAQRFEEAGIRRLHMVDLDGAKASEPRNLAVLERVATKTTLEVQYGGGIKSRGALRSVFGAGASRAICGSIAVRVWYKSQNEYYFEVKNKSAQDAQIQVRMGDGRKVDVDVYGKVDEGILLAPGFASVSGIFKIKA